MILPVPRKMHSAFNALRKKYHISHWVSETSYFIRVWKSFTFQASSFLLLFSVKLFCFLFTSRLSLSSRFFRISRYFTCIYDNVFSMLLESRNSFLIPYRRLFSNDFFAEVNDDKGAQKAIQSKYHFISAPLKVIKISKKQPFLYSKAIT